MPDSVIPLVDLGRQHASLREDILDVAAEILDRAAFVGGSHVEAFEAAFAAHVGSRFCIGTANGTDALTIALEALGLQPGDEVVVPALSFFATAEAVSLARAVPVFADIDPCTANLDPARLEPLIGPRTRAVIAVHLYGQPAAMDELTAVARRHGLFIVEDCAQAQGARHRGRRVGSLGDVAAFSFYPSKNLGALGDAGALVTDDPELARRCRMLANHGGTRKYEHLVVGHNSRLDALQAAVLGLKLPRLDRWNRERGEIAASYRRLLADAPVEFLAEIPDVEHVHHLFVVRVAGRDRVVAGLRRRGIMAEIHYPQALPLVPAYASMGHRAGDFPAASRHTDQCLSLPIFPGMRADEVRRVADALQASLAG